MNQKQKALLKSFFISIQHTVSCMILAICFVWSLAATVFSTAFIIPLKGVDTAVPMIIGGVLTIYVSAVLLGNLDVECYEHYLRDNHMTDDYLKYKKAYVRGEK